MLQAVLFFPHPGYFIWPAVSTSVTRVSVFFEDKLVTLRKPFGHNSLKNDVAIDLEGHLIIVISHHVIELQFRFEVIAKCSPNVESLVDFLVGDCSVHGIMYGEGGPSVGGQRKTISPR